MAWSLAADPTKKMYGMLPNVWNESVLQQHMNGFTHTYPVFVSANWRWQIYSKYVNTVFKRQAFQRVRKLAYVTPSHFLPGIGLTVGDIAIVKVVAERRKTPSSSGKKAPVDDDDDEDESEDDT
jgi:hypothetical protein